MARKRKNVWICLVGVVLAIAVCGCQYSGNAKMSGEALQMPDIVFLNTIFYGDSYDGSKCAITFYDKNGDHYTSYDEYICTLSFDKLCEEYAAGKLDDKIDYHISCDKDELYKNYRKLCKISKKKVNIKVPNAMPAVEADHIRWYGLYYDDEGKIQYILIHENQCMTECYSNNSKANDIYKWYIGTFKNKDDGADKTKISDNSNPKEKLATKVKNIFDADNFETFSEKAHMDEILTITGVLNREDLFFVINDVNKPDIRAVYLYYIYDDLYEKSVFPIDYSKNEVIAADFVKQPGGRAYVLCPEYTVEEAITTPDSDAAKEVGTFIPDEIYDDVNKAGTYASDEASDNVVSYGEREVGGEPMFRIYEIDPDAKGSIRFVLRSSLESEYAKEWGGFVIDCDRLTVSDESDAK